MKRIVHKGCSLIMICVMIIFCLPTYAFANNDIIRVNGNSIHEYNYDINDTAEFTQSKVYDNNHKLIAMAILNKKTNIAQVTNLENNVTAYVDIKRDNFAPIVSSFAYQPLASKVTYKHVTTHKGDFSVIGLGVAGIAALILSLVPGAGWAAVIAIGHRIIDKKLEQLDYTVDLYTANSGSTYYTKRVFKVFEKGTNNQIGDDIVTSNTSHHH